MIQDSRNQRCIVIKAQETLENLEDMKYKMNLYGCLYLDMINNKFAQPKSAFLVTPLRNLHQITNITCMLSFKMRAILDSALILRCFGP